MKTAARTSVAILALLVGLLFCFAAVRGYMQHNNVAFRPLLFGLVGVGGVEPEQVREYGVVTAAEDDAVVEVLGHNLHRALLVRSR